MLQLFLVLIFNYYVYSQPMSLFKNTFKWTSETVCTDRRKKVPDRGAVNWNSRKCYDKLLSCVTAKSRRLPSEVSAATLKPLPRSANALDDWRGNYGLRQRNSAVSVLFPPLHYIGKMSWQNHRTIENNDYHQYLVRRSYLVIITTLLREHV